MKRFQFLQALWLPEELSWVIETEVPAGAFTFLLKTGRGSPKETAACTAGRMSMIPAA
jgi:hypothetical protein